MVPVSVHWLHFGMTALKIQKLLCKVWSIVVQVYVEQQAHSKITMVGFIDLKLWKSDSGSTRNRFHTCPGHRVQPLIPMRIFGICWRKLSTAVWLSNHQLNNLVKINATLYGNKIGNMMNGCRNQKWICSVWILFSFYIEVKVRNLFSCTIFFL